MNLEVIIIGVYLILLFFDLCCCCLAYYDAEQEKEYERNLATIARFKRSNNQCVVRYENEVQPNSQPTNIYNRSTCVTNQAFQTQPTRQAIQSIETKTWTHSDEQNVTSDPEIAELTCSDRQRAQPIFVATTLANSALHLNISDTLDSNIFIGETLPTPESIIKPSCVTHLSWTHSDKQEVTRDPVSCFEQQSAQNISVAATSETSDSHSTTSDTSDINISFRESLPTIINKSSCVKYSSCTHSDEKNVTRDAELTDLSYSDRQSAQPISVATLEISALHSNISDTSDSNIVIRETLPTPELIIKPSCATRQSWTHSDEQKVTRDPLSCSDRQRVQPISAATALETSASHLNISEINIVVGETLPTPASVSRPRQSLTHSDELNVTRDPLSCSDRQRVQPVSAATTLATSSSHSNISDTSDSNIVIRETLPAPASSNKPSCAKNQSWTYSDEDISRNPDQTGQSCSDRKDVQPNSETKALATPASVYPQISDIPDSNIFIKETLPPPQPTSNQNTTCPSTQTIPSFKVQPGIHTFSYEKPVSFSKIPKATIAVDASKHGFGGYCVLENINLIKYYSVKHEKLSKEFRINDIYNSGELEMKNLLFALKQFRKDIAGHHLTLFTDSNIVNSMHNRHAQAAYSFLNELKANDDIVHVNREGCYVNNHKDPEKFTTTIVPADALSRFKVQEFLDCMKDIHPNMRLKRIWVKYFN